MMTIQVDSREKSHAIQHILTDFKRAGAKWFVSKMYVGDYMSLDNPRLAIDRKQNLAELCGNVCREHERFRAELIRAQEAGIKLIILCEHGDGIRTLEDVLFWVNPRHRVKKLIKGRWVWAEQHVMHGDVLYKILTTMERKYGVTFLFCDRTETGRRIIELLGGTDGRERNQRPHKDD